MTTKKITPSEPTGIKPIDGFRIVYRDQPNGLLIFALNWGIRTEYPEGVGASYGLWSHWIRQKPWTWDIKIRHHGSKGSKTKLLQAKRKINVPD